MNPSQMFVLYSKYSNACKNIMKHSSDQLASHIRFICIDKTDIRRMIEKSKKLIVKQVPCVVLYYPDGRVEKYEGPGVDEWILEQIAPPDVGEIHPETQAETPSRSTQIASQTQAIPGTNVMDIPTNAIKDKRSVAEIAEEIQEQRNRIIEKTKNDNRPM